MNGTKWPELLKSFLQQIPSLLTFLGCMIFVIARWKRYPRVSMIVLIALLADLLSQILFTFIYNWVPDWLIGAGPYNAVHARNVFFVLGLIANSVTAVVIGLYLAAIFSNRRPREMEVS